MSRHSNISIFVPHAGCPFKCSFCDQNTISGENDLPRGEDVKRICEQAKREIRDPANTEIAFFGGSFTAIERSYMTELLDAAAPFIGKGGFKGIRLSTRPDCIDSEVLGLLKKYGVTAIELGAQSLSDEVLSANRRGHTAEDIKKASEQIKSQGFELGLQLMVGLYRSDEETERANIEKVLEIAPDTVRIYPVVILEHTLLGSLYRSGKYLTMPFETVVAICSDMLLRFENAGIRVIKCGLHASEFVERDMIGGFYHPAFRELCESEIFRKMIEAELKRNRVFADKNKKTTVLCAVSPKSISKAAGHGRSNTEHFRKMGIELKFVPDENAAKYSCKVLEVKQCT